MEEAKPFPHFGTEAIHAGQEPEQWNSMAVVPPISMSTTFKQPAPAEHVVGISYHADQSSHRQKVFAHLVPSVMHKT